MNGYELRLGVRGVALERRMVEALDDLWCAGIRVTRLKVSPADYACIEPVPRPGTFIGITSVSQGPVRIVKDPNLQRSWL